jgi:hypothetical protein
MEQQVFFSRYRVYQIWQVRLFDLGTRKIPRRTLMLHVAQHLADKLD